MVDISTLFSIYILQLFFVSGIWTQVNHKSINTCKIFHFNSVYFLIDLYRYVRIVACILRSSVLRKLKVKRESLWTCWIDGNREIGFVLQQFNTVLYSDSYVFYTQITAIIKSVPCKKQMLFCRVGNSVYFKNR